MPQTTERKIIGPATAFRKPRKVSRSGEMTPCCSAEDIFAGNALVASPRTKAATIAISSFPHSGMLFFAVACAVSYLISGYSGLYTSQTILYSKQKAQYINVHTKE